MARLTNTTVLITGATAGIGRSCAYAFAREGARLILTGRRTDRLSTIADELQTAYGRDVFTSTLDVRDREAVFGLISSLQSEWNSIDILVNNAGLGRGLDKIHEGNVDDWEEMIDTNVKGLLFMTRAVLPGMVKRRKGHVINIGSIAGHETYPGGNVYNATKFAVDAITKAARMDLVDTHIRISTVDPGMVETDFSRVRFHGDEERAKKVYADITPCTPDDVADAVVYCATRPPHVSINQIVIMPTAQASAMVAYRGELK